MLVSSIVAPFIFIILTNKSGLFYHFLNLIIINTFLYFYISTSIILNSILNIKKYKIEFKSILIALIIFVYWFNNYQLFKNKLNNKDYIAFREGINNVTKIIKAKNNVNIKLVTFDPELMVWSIMNDIKFIKPLSGQLVPKKHILIENDLIEVFKFLKLSSDQFLYFFRNKFSSWRLYNKNTQIFFWGRYTANQFKTFDNQKSYNQKESDFINNISPMISQSIAIPINEFERLKFKFENQKINKEFIPDVIVLNQNEEIFKNILIENYFMCKNISNSQIIIYLLSQDNNKIKC